MTRWFKKHPVLRDVLIWCIPALLFGAVLRALLIHSSPYAFFGADSRSFMGFTNGVLTDFYFSINEKRRYLYPLFVFPFSLLPGGTLRWLAVVQAGLGLLSILPIAYIVRRCFGTWRWTIIPVTVLFAGMPVFLWFEHELIADSFFFQSMNWVLGGWVAWTIQANPGRGRALWWWFWVPFAILLLTKPAGKLLWPGVAIGLVIVCSWRILRWPEWTAIAALFLASLTVGDENQSSWLIYTTTFPLTQLDTPLHAEYKAEIRDLVMQKRALFADYHKNDGDIHDFLRSPLDFPQFPKWGKLSKKKRDVLYKDLAFEGIKARPDLFVRIALQRLAGSCNQEDFKTSRFYRQYYSERFHEQYYGPPEKSMLRIAFGIPKNAPYPTYEEMCALVTPLPHAFSTEFILAYSNAYQRFGDLINRSTGHLTILGLCVLLGAALSVFPPFLKTLGVWTVAFGGYLFAVYLIGIENHRYFALVWPSVLVLLALVFEMAWRGVDKLAKKR
jgi:hypothetical protein